MKAKIIDVKTFKEAVIVSSDVLFEFQIECSSEGIRWVGLDKGKVCFIQSEFKTEFFEEYECDRPEKIIIDSHEFFEVMKRATNKDILELSSNDYSLDIKYSNSKGERVFNIKYIDSVDYQPPMPKIPYTYSDLRVPFKEFFEYLNDCQLYSDTVKFEVKDDKLIIYSNADLGSYEGKINLDDKYDEAISSIFGINFLIQFKKFSEFDELYLSLGDDFPCSLKVKNEANGVECIILIANRIEDPD